VRGLLFLGPFVLKIRGIAYPAPTKPRHDHAVYTLMVHLPTSPVLPSLQGVSLITGLLITGMDWTGLDWNPKICFYALWYAICHE